MAIQLSAAFTALENVLQDTSDVTTANEIQWSQFLSDFVYRIISDIDPERFITELNINVTSGTSSYALPTDFKNIQEWGTGLYIQNNSGVNTDDRLPMTSFGSSVRGYYISGGNIILTPAPTKSETLVFRYIPKSPVFTATTEYFTMNKTLTGTIIIPDEFLQYVQTALTVLYSVWDEDLGMESYSDARFVRCLDELARNIKREPLAYGLPDFSQGF